MTIPFKITEEQKKELANIADFMEAQGYELPFINELREIAMVDQCVFDLAKLWAEATWTSDRNRIMGDIERSIYDYRYHLNGQFLDKPGKTWLEVNIEPQIQKEVKLLRDNGFNTTWSCEHEGAVECTCALEGEAWRLHNVLAENGYRNYEIESSIRVVSGHPYPKLTVIFQDIRLSDGKTCGTIDEDSTEGRPDSPSDLFENNPTYPW